MGANGEKRLLKVVLSSLALGLAACAVPVPPSGGPADTTPPALVSSTPASGSVRFSGDRIRIEFDEYVDERSTSSSIQVTPTPIRPPEIRYGGKSVEVRFREPLRDSTTYIITLDSGFRDAHGAALKAPIQIAFSTGDVIDSGRLSGRVLDADSGRPSASVDVFAYSLEPGVPLDSLPAEPSYRTQADAEGRFRLEHLASRPFLVVAVRDMNRNRKLDPNEAFAVPPVERLIADSSGREPDRRWLLARRDVTPPELRRTAARSSSRIEMLFSEGVLLADPGRLSVEDSSGSRSMAVRLVASRPGDPRTLVLRTDPLSSGWWAIRGDSAIADSAGNVLKSFRGDFAASATADTARARIRGFEGDTLGTATINVRELAPWSAATIGLTDLLDPDSLRHAMAVTDTSGNSLEFELVSIGRGAFRVIPATSPFDVVVRPPVSDTVLTVRYAFAPPGRLGELSGVAVGGSPIVVELHPAAPRSEPVRRAVAGGDGRFVFDRLPGGRRYRIRAFVDEDGNGEWTPGNPAPWANPEPVTWLGTLPAVRARWETALPDTVRIGVPTGGVAPDGE